jgi:CO/xanthine dehydrogenase Mo-binding subunit
MTFDASGQPLPTATSAPRIETHHRQAPIPFNPIGVKGAGVRGPKPCRPGTARFPPED